MSRLLLYIGCFSAVLLGSPILRAQPTGLAFEHLTMQQGLPSDWINSLLIDHKGYLWVATSAGLCRYNGYDFVTYKFNPHDPRSPEQNPALSSLFEDEAGEIWVGNIEGGINLFDRETENFINYRPPQPPGRFETVLRAVSAMNQDRQGLYWVGSYSGELRRFDKATGQFSSFDYSLGYHPVHGDLRPYDRINCIYRDKNHDLWIGNKSGLHKLVLTPGSPFDSASAHFLHFAHNPADSNSLEGEEVWNIFEDHAGVLWVSTETTLNRLDRQTGRFTHYRYDAADPASYSGTPTGTIAEDANDYLWITLNKGVIRLDPQRRHFDHFDADPGNPNSIRNIGTSHLAIDQAGDIWIGGYGIDKLDPHQPPIRTYAYDNKEAGHAMKGKFGAMLEDHTGTVWLSNGDGLNAMDRRTGRFTHHYRHDPADSHSISSDWCSALLEDGEGMIWVATWSGTLDRFDPRTGRFTHYIGPDGRFKNVERHYYHILFEDHRGIIWIGESSSGLSELDYKKGTITHFGHDPADPTGLSDYQTNCLAEDRQGYLWIGHGSVATDRLDPRTGRIRHYQYQPGHPAGISSNAVNVIITDSRGRLWFGTGGGGICRYDEPADTFTTYTERDGLLDNSINSIIEDKTGTLWLGTGEGICRFSPDKKLFTDFNYPNMPVDNHMATLFGQTRDGCLWFSVMGDRIRTFDPAALHPNTYVPPVVITRFKIFDQERPGSDEISKIELPYNQNFFSFEFSALNYTDSRKNQYIYRLEGVDKQWVRSGTRRSAEYTDIAPGTYTFRVKGSNNEGIWNDSDASIRIIIYPPWWRTWWAYAIYALCILALWYYTESRQRKRLIARERDRSKARDLEMRALRAQMNPHFIFNSLTSINRFILKNDSLAASDYLTRFSRLIRMVLNHSKLTLIPLEDELDMLRLYLDMEKLRFKDAFSYTIDAGADLESENILIPPMLFQPFVENAIWHGLMHKTEPGRLDILLRIRGDILTCTITDNGVGRVVSAAASSKSAQKQKSMGIDITKQRLNLINGQSDNDHSLQIEDLYNDQGAPAGTRVTIRIRIRATSQNALV